MANAAPIASVIEITSLDPDSRIDPDPKLHAVRAACPAFRDEAAKVWLLTRYGDVRAALNDRSMLRYPGHAELGSITRNMSNPNTPADIPMSERQSILLLDDPEHGRIRMPLAKALYARVAKVKPLVETVIDETLGKLQGQPRFDVIAEAALPIPIVVLARIMGVDEDRLIEFRRWSEDVLQGVNPARTPDQNEQMHASNTAIQAYLRQLMGERRKTPCDDLVTDLVRLQKEGAPINDTEICLNLVGLIVAGNLTTTDLIGNGILLLLRHPDQFEKLKADPSLVAGAVEEILRFESPLDASSRIVPESREVAGCPMHRGASLILSVRGANHDPDAFPDPDRFDITRKGAPHVAFGGGAHICIGAPLARLEAVAFFSAFIRRFPNVRLDEKRPRWRNQPFFRGLDKLVLVAP